MSRKLMAASWILLLLVPFTAAANDIILPRQPTIHGGQVVFVYADQLWSVDANGGRASQLTSGEGEASHPHFSPDGRLIAFSLSREGNQDVYVMDAAGGEARRLTWHPGDDEVVGFTADGTSVLFRSGRNSYRSFNRLFTIPVAGGLPRQLPLPTAEDGSYSPDGSHIAYVPFSYISTGMAFKHYRGGRQARIWIAKLEDSSVIELPRDGSRNFNPIWVGDTIYFLSDRKNGVVTLYRYDTATGKVVEVLPAEGPDIQSASAGSGEIVYETVGALHVVDLGSGKSRRIPIRIDADFAEVHPHFLDVGDQILSSGISPTGVRAVFAAHGDILTVPAKHGDIRNVTHSPGVHERDPAWSPDGRWIAYFSDRSGEYALYLSAQDGLSEPRRIDLHQAGLFYYLPVWSPDSRKIAYEDQFHNLWYVDVATGKTTKVASDQYYSIGAVVDKPTFDAVFSPDSRYLAYARLMPNHMRSVFVYSLSTGKASRLTDGGADARYVAWDKSGKFLYFAASTTVGPLTGWLNMSSYKRPVTWQVYAVVLRHDQPSPLAPRAEKEHGVHGSGAMGAQATAQSGGKSAADDRAVRIDFDGIERRIVALPIPAKYITGLASAGPGVLFVATSDDPLYDSVSRGGTRGEPQTLYKFDLASRKAKQYAEGVSTYSVSADGKWILLGERGHDGGKWSIAATDAEDGSKGAEVVATGSMKVWVDPRAEWKQMYAEEWRIIRDFFYDKNLHGLDSRHAEEIYQPYVDHLASRSGLDYIFHDMRGELVNSHVFSGNAYARSGAQPDVGLLGVDFAVSHGHYQFARIYGAGSWNPDLKAPLSQPGLDVRAGDYLLAVDGHAVSASDNVYRAFKGTADKQTTITVGSDPGGKGARNIVVVPIKSEAALREQAWVDHNLAEVDRLGHGRIAYVYLPDTSGGGYRNFNRYFFSQVDKQAVIIDERFNGGGFIADYVIDYLSRKLLNYWQTREAHNYANPVDAILGPKVMLTNGFSVSGGDALPFLFKELRIGPLIGMRTTGGLNAVAGVPRLIDGTMASVPRMAIYSPDGKRVVENIGVAPDIRVPLDPKAWRQGRDPQLERGVQEILESLKQHPPANIPAPGYEDYHQRPAVSPPGSVDR
ncbi:MAG TPA: PDZ domain-containing protein [Rhodanobacteraceae bacterium]|nr:PDZ domain-containing protein [Rhodanobacteraceae bacterium]